MKRCDSCGKIKFSLIRQTNFGVTREMCRKCCEAANEVERMMTPAPHDRHDDYERRAHMDRKPHNVPSNWLEIYLSDRDGDR